MEATGSLEIEDLHSKHLQKKQGEQIAQWSFKHFVTGRISNVQQQTGNQDQLSLQVTCTTLSEASEVNFTSSFYIYDHFNQKYVLHFITDILFIPFTTKRNLTINVTMLP